MPSGRASDASRRARVTAVLPSGQGPVPAPPTTRAQCRRDGECRVSSALCAERQQQRSRRESPCRASRAARTCHPVWTLRRGRARLRGRHGNHCRASAAVRGFMRGTVTSLPQVLVAPRSEVQSFKKVSCTTSSAAAGDAAGPSRAIHGPQPAAREVQCRLRDMGAIHLIVVTV